MTESQRTYRVMGLPANVPVEYLYSVNGLHHYASHCCKPIPHTGIIVTSEFISEPYGCTNTDPIVAETLVAPASTKQLEPSEVIVHKVEKGRDEGRKGPPQDCRPDDQRKEALEPALLRQVRQLKFEAASEASDETKQIVKMLADKYFVEQRLNRSGGNKGGRKGMPWWLLYHFASEVNADTGESVSVIGAVCDSANRVFWLQTIEALGRRIIVTIA